MEVGQTDFDGEVDDGFKDDCEKEESTRYRVGKEL